MPAQTAQELAASYYTENETPNVVCEWMEFSSTRVLNLVRDSATPASGTRLVTFRLDPFTNQQFFDYRRGEKVDVPTGNGNATVSCAAPDSWTNLTIPRTLPEGWTMAITNVSVTVEEVRATYTAAPADVTSGSATEAAYTGALYNGARVAVADPLGLMGPSSFNAPVSACELGLRKSASCSLRTTEDGPALLSGSLRDFGAGERGVRQIGYGDGVNSTYYKSPRGIVWSNRANRKEDAQLFFRLSNASPLVLPFQCSPTAPGSTTYMVPIGGTVEIVATVSGYTWRPNTSVNS